MTTTPTLWLGAQQANTTDTGTGGDDQTGIQLVGLANGNFVALWESNTDDGAGSADGTDIIGQLYNALGAKIGGEFRANQGFFSDDEGDFTAAALSDGRFVIAYEDTNADGTAIRYNILSATGTVTETGTIASDPGAQDLGSPAITVNADGRSFLVAYQQRDAGANTTATFATLVDDTGATGSPMLLLAGNLSDDVAANGQQVATAGLSNGNYAIVSRALDGDNGLLLRVINAEGGNVLSFTEVANTIGNGEGDLQPSIAAIAGGFVIAWQNTDSADTDILFQRYNLSGVPQGTLLSVNGVSTTDNNVNPSVVGLSDGGFVIVHDDNEVGSIVLQRFSSTGSIVGTEVTVTTGGLNPTISLSDDGRLLVGYGTSVFTSGFNFDNDVAFAIFDPRENVISGDGTANVITSRLDGADVSGFGGDDTLLGQGAADTLRGGDGEDSIVGGDGGDFIEGGFNADTIRGGTGDDLIFGMLQSDVGGSGVADLIDGDSGDDTIFGSAAGDTLRGGDDNDSIDGGDGADFIEGGFSADTILGGLGADVIFGMTQIDPNGSGFADSIDGGDGDDRIIGSSVGDTLLGGAGSDTIDGGLGADTMTGGASNDFYTVDNVGDKVVEAGNSGVDVVSTTLASYTLTANVDRLVFTDAGNHTGRGNDLDNRLNGNAGLDKFIIDAGGDDIFSGGAGEDSFDGRSSGTGMILRLDNQTLNAGSVTGDTFASVEKFFGSNTAADVMTTGAARAKFSGFGGNDTLTGGSSIDALNGGADNDRLFGNGGQDALDGGTGNDTMTGGAARDSFNFIDAAFGQDRITEYEDGSDFLKVFSAVADNINDFTITNNGTTQVTLTLNAATSNTITLQSATAITITSADFLFF